MSDPYASFDVDQVRHFMVETNPWARLAGIEVCEVGPGHIRMQLPPSANIENPMQAYHAGALFTFAETAAAALAVVSYDMTGGKAVLIKSATIDYLKVVRETIEIDARMAQEQIDAMNAGVAAEGRFAQPVTVSMRLLDGTEVCTSTMTVHVRQTGS